MTQPLELTPPQNIELEMCVLGAIMLEPKHGYPVAAEFLERESFYLDGHGLIFQIMGELHNRGLPPDVDAVIDEIKSRQLEKKIDGIGSLLSMLNSVASAANLVVHAKKIAEKQTLRAILRACTQIIEECYRQELPAAEILEQMDKAAGQLSANVHQSRVSHISDSLKDVWEGINARDDAIKADLAAGRTPGHLFTGLPSGFPDLDVMLRGLRDNELTVIGGHVSEGKTALALSIVRHLAIRNELPVAIFSLEMNEATLSERMLSMGTKHWSQSTIRGMPVTAFEAPNFSQSDWNILTQSCNTLLTSPVYWVCHPYLTIAQIGAELRQLHRQHGIRAAFVDYLQLISPSRRRENRTVEVGDISRGLKALAKEIDIPLIGLSQLGRAHLGKYPTIDQLRESGDIASDADNIVLIWRKDVHDREQLKRADEMRSQWLIDNPDQEPPEQLPEVDLVIVKNRNGPLGTVTVRFYKELTLFLSASRL